MEIGRIQQNYPATTFKAGFNVWCAESRLESTVQKCIHRWESEAKYLGDDSTGICVTISPHDTGYGLTYADKTQRRGFAPYVQTDVRINLFSDIIPNYFKEHIIKTEHDFPEGIFELENKLKRIVDEWLYELKCEVKSNKWKR